MKKTTSKTQRPRGAAKTKAKHPFDNTDATTKALALQKHPKDPERMGDFYVVMKPMVDRALESKFARGVDQATREDLSQDVLLKAMAKLAQFNPNKASLFNWVTAIIRTTSVDYYRKSRREIPTAVLKDTPAGRQVMLEVDADTLSEMRAFFPFYVSTRVFNDLFAAAERYKFKANNSLMDAVSKIFAANKIKYAEFGTLLDYTQFLIALYRAWMVSDDPRLFEKLEIAIKESQSAGVTRVLAHYMSPKQLAILLHICGGMNVKLPTPRKLLEAPRNVR